MINFLYAWWSGVLAPLMITPEVFNVMLCLLMGWLASMGGWQSGLIMNFVLATVLMIAWILWGLPSDLATMWFIFSFVLLAFGLFVDKNQGVLPQ
jgi:hypothetical protein